MLAWLLEWFSKAGGYIGVFMLSLISNAIPYSTIPYLFWLIPVFTRIQDTRILALTIVSAALGASLGKIIVYLIGRSLSSIGSRSRFKENITYLASTQSKALFVTVLLVAATPLPDDVVYIPLGYAGYNILIFFTALLLGKLTITFLAAVFGRSLSFLFEENAGLPSWLATIIYIVITLVIMYVTGSIDWVKVSSTAREKGLREALKLVIKETYTSLLRIPSVIQHFLKRIRVV
ncbi:MAG: VTT domain-containing protein [Desulfurococcus sp.]|nr:VTT domain-containing protein [Desulfurococcus sp.]